MRLKERLAQGRCMPVPHSYLFVFLHELAKTKCFLFISQLTYNMEYNSTVTRQYFYNALLQFTLTKYSVCARVYIFYILYTRYTTIQI